MFAFQLEQIELMEGWVDRDSTLRGRFAFPLTAAQGAASSSLIYFEIDPAHKVPRHTHTAEEVLLILAGTCVVEVDGEHADGRQGAVVLVPAHAPHGIENTGADTLKVVGFFASAAMVHTYEASIEPLGTDIIVTPQPEDVMAVTGMREIHTAQHAG